MVVVERQESNIGRVPCQTETEGDVLGIGCVWMLLAQVFYRYYGVRKMQWWWWWWDDRNGRTGGARVLPCETENRA